MQKNDLKMNLNQNMSLCYKYPIADQNVLKNFQTSRNMIVYKIYIFSLSKKFSRFPL